MNAIEVRGLGKSYGDVSAVENFSLLVGKQALVAVAGPDGAGKTSVFRAACGLIGFDTGEVRVAGYDVRTDFESVKPLLGYMPQAFSLYPDLSVEENLRFYAGLFGLGREAFDRKKQQLYDFSGLGPFSGRRAEHLSGGMKQKLALSCNLVHDPEILVLDEPTTGVDPLSRRQFWDILKDLRRRGASILVSTPYMDELGLADKAVLMSGGRKIAEGTPEQLVRAYRGEVFILPRIPTSEEVRVLKGTEGIVARRYGAALRVYTPEGMGLDEVAGEISKAGIDSSGIEKIEPDLEDVFVQAMATGPTGDAPTSRGGTGLSPVQ
jgi:ABC-2 type transport system ATP-binding protein